MDSPGTRYSHLSSGQACSPCLGWEREGQRRSLRQFPTMAFEDATGFMTVFCTNGQFETSDTSLVLGPHQSLQVCLEIAWNRAHHQRALP